MINSITTSFPALMVVLAASLFVSVVIFLTSLSVRAAPVTVQLHGPPRVRKTLHLFAVVFLFGAVSWLLCEGSTWGGGNRTQLRASPPVVETSL